MTIDLTRVQKKAELSASDFYRLMYDPFWIWCQFYAPKEEAVEVEDRYLELLFENGNLFEEKKVKEIYPNYIKVSEYGEEAAKRTIELMMRGVDVIYQPFFVYESESMKGKADLLIKDTTRGSKLGNYHYRVEEIKNSNELKSHYKLQVACYNFMVGAIQGYVPEKFEIILKDKKESVDYKKVEKDFNKYVQLWRDIRDEKIIPLPSGIDKTDSPWQAYANKILLQNNDLTLLPGVGSGYRKKIQEKFGIKSITEFNGITENALVELFKGPIGTLIYHHAHAYNSKKHLPINGPPNIERRKRSMYFDLETSDHVHPSELPHTYLIGVWDKELNKFVYFLGNGKKDEERIWKEFLDYVGDPKNVYLYHWASYEKDTIDKTINEYPKLATQLKELKESCVNLLEVVKKNYYIPVPTYSIKKVAPFLGFNWRQKDVGAFESMVLYWDWLKNLKQDIIDKVIKYNEDDCMAMAYIDEKLFSLKQD